MIFRKNAYVPPPEKAGNRAAESLAKAKEARLKNQVIVFDEIIKKIDKASSDGEIEITWTDSSNQFIIDKLVALGYKVRTFSDYRERKCLKISWGTES